ncbi:MAG: hypothetical protein AB1600_09550, partial [Bacteroidota bacterium]
APIVGDNIVSMGNLHIPVSSLGEAFCDNRLSLYRLYEISASRGQGMIGTEGFEYPPDGLRYNVHTRMLPEYFTTSPKDTVKNLKNFSKFYAGKVVVINWMNSSASDPFDKVPVAAVIFSVLKNDIYAKKEWLTNTSVLFVILLLGIASMRLKLLWISCISLFLLVAIGFFSLWMFSSYKFIFDPVYTVFAVFLSGSVFPLLKLFREQ